MQCGEVENPGSHFQTGPASTLGHLPPAGNVKADFLSTNGRRVNLQRSLLTFKSCLEDEIKDHSPRKIGKSHCGSDVLGEIKFSD